MVGCRVAVMLEPSEVPAERRSRLLSIVLVDRDREPLGAASLVDDDRLDVGAVGLLDLLASRRSRG